MSDPVLLVGVGGLAVATLGPLVVQAVGKIRGKPAIVAASAPTMGVPSRYRWTEQEVDALNWAVAQIPDSVTVSEFLGQMAVDEMVSETCVRLLSPVKDVSK